MGYPLSAAGRAAFLAINIQTVAIAVTPVTGSAFTITEADIRQGGMTIDRFSTAGQTIEVGACPAGELSLTLDNATGSFDSAVFEGAQMVVTVSCSDGVNTYSVPMGYFTVDEAPKIRKIISITALDRMVQFDKEIIKSDFDFTSMTVQALVNRLCADCNVVMSSSVDMTTMANYDLELTEPGGDGYTYRQWLMWCCQMLGVCGYMDWNGELRLEWYHTADASEDPGKLTGEIRFSSDYDEGVVALTGLQSVAADGQTVLIGSEGYVLDLSANEFLSATDPAQVMAATFNYIGTTAYTPFNASALPMPWLWPLDKVWFYYVGDSVNNFVSYATNVNFKLNTKMSVQGKGMSPTRKGYASANPLTAQEQAIINQLQQNQSAALDSATANLLHFNELISNALGLYFTAIPQSGGGTVYYMHDQPQLEDSNVIFTGTANGIAWTTTGWNGGAPVWKYGVTAAGAAFFETLAANRVSADWVQTGILQSADSGQTFFLDLDNGVLRMNVSSLELNGQSINDAIGSAASGAVSGVQGQVNTLTSHISYENGKLIFSVDPINPGDPVFSLTIDNDSVDILNGSSVIGTFSSGGTTTPELTIPQNGSLTMYPYKWISRSSGHLQLVFVGM